MQLNLLTNLSIYQILDTIGFLDFIYRPAF
jgi:hypothetical protein